MVNIGGKSWGSPLHPEVVQHLLVDRVRARLVADNAIASLAAVVQALRAEGVVASDEVLLGLARTVMAHCGGLGVLQPLLDDERVSDIVVNGPEQVYVDRGSGLEHVELHLGSPQDVLALATRLANQAGRRLDPSSPWVDAPLWGSIRLHAIIPPLASPSTLISLRIPRKQVFTVEQLLACGTLTSAMAQAVRAVMDARLAVLVAGGTGSGKTTILGALLGLAAPNQRLLLVEDTSELIVNHPHVVRLQTRPANTEGSGQVSLRELIRQGLRMRPDRLVVGEVRGADVVDLLGALNTGHEGGCATIHANTCADVPARIEALAGLAGVGREAIHSQMAAALQVVVGMRRLTSGQRVMAQLGVAVAEAGTVRVVPALTEQGLGEGYARLVSLMQAHGHPQGGEHRLGTATLPSRKLGASLTTSGTSRDPGDKPLPELGQRPEHP